MTRKSGPGKIRRRRTSVRIGGTTQSGFASRSMSEVLKGQEERAPDDAGPDAGGKTGSRKRKNTDGEPEGKGE